MKPKPILCPRCHSKNVRVVEYASHEIVYTPDMLEGTQRQGDIDKIVLQCRACGHGHTMRGRNMIDDELKARLAANAD